MLPLKEITMRSSFCALLLFVAVSAQAEETVDLQELTFLDENYVCRFVAGNEQEKLAEYTLVDESIDDWKKLVAVRHYPLAEAAPADAAREIVKALNQAQPAAKHQLLVKEDGTEALLDFLIWPQDASYVEFNVFRLIQTEDEGLVSYQFAFRFKDTSPESIEKFKKARQLWLEEMREVEWDVEFSEE
jgi:hypothetical protein